MELLNIYYNNIILVPVVTFVFAVIIKGINIRLITGKINLSKTLGSGGMPSSHSAIVVSLATAIALKHGINSDLFAMAFIFTIIIIYDAINVRFEAGLHASAINQSLGEKKFKESLGHLPSEAFAGSVIGIIVAIILYFI